MLSKADATPRGAGHMPLLLKMSFVAIPTSATVKDSQSSGD
jgi:hypothetical protein